MDNLELIKLVDYINKQNNEKIKQTKELEEKLKELMQQKGKINEAVDVNINMAIIVGYTDALADIMRYINKNIK